VTKGEDPFGITDDVGWKGGGGFKVLEVAPSMFAHNTELDIVYLSDWATQGYLAQATAAQMGYAYVPDGPFAGHKGKSRLVVVDGLVNDAVLRMLLERLGEDELLEVAATSIDPKAAAVLSELRQGSRLRKIPQAILRSYQRASHLRKLLRSANQEEASPAEEAGEGIATEVRA
jgi:adenine-specific DNA-methyltransferase